MLQDNLKKTAVALEYEKGDMAPKVIASGRKDTEQIRTITFDKSYIL